MMIDDMELVRQYAAGESEQAFETLVSRHVSLVYSAALRQARDPHLAEEITQAVFVILARKARSLSAKTILAGWLYRTARFVTADALRRESRRQRHLQEAQMHAIMESEGQNAWQDVEPLLDEAMAELRAKDRDVLIMRFFQNKSLQEVGVALGIEERAAQKRVARGLERLRAFLERRGVVLSVAVIASAVAANSVQAAPAGLTISAAAVAQGSAASASTVTLVKGALKLMAWTQAKIAVGVAAGVLITAGTATFAVAELGGAQTESYSWQVEKPTFDLLRQTPPQVKVLPSKFEKGGGGVGENDKSLGISLPVGSLIRSAYGVSEARTILPPDAPAGRFDYIANLPQGSKEALQQEIQTQLGLVGKREVRMTDVLVLKVKTPGSPGLKTPAPKRGNGGARIAMAAKAGGGRQSWFDQPLAGLTQFFEGQLKMPVIDRTGLTNHYDFDYKWDVSQQHPTPKDWNQSLDNQLGLELVPGRENIEMLIVERVKN